MTALSSMDVQALNAAILELHATPTMEEFSLRITAAMRSVMSGEICAVNWIDRRTSLALFTVYHPAAPVSEEINTLAQALISSEAPFWLHCADEPQAASDRMSRTDWRKRNIHWACRQVDKEEFICFDVPLTSSLMLSLAEMRGRYGMYSATERLKLKLLGPHLQQIYSRLAAQAGLTPAGHRNLRVAQAPVGLSGQKCAWTTEARHLLADYGVVVFGDLLPDVIKEWFVAQRRALEQPSEISKGLSPLRFRRTNRLLSLYLMRNPQARNYCLIMQEKELAEETPGLFPGLGLTGRESEVFSWLSEGKSNPEIAIILGISPGTVGRHVENIFSKLGLENRYVAGLMASRLLAAKTKSGVPRKS